MPLDDDKIRKLIQNGADAWAIGQAAIASLPEEQKKKAKEDRITHLSVLLRKGLEPSAIVVNDQLIAFAVKAFKERLETDPEFFNNCNRSVGP